MTTEQLERRVADLERTVAALQRQVAELAADDGPPIELTPELRAEIERRIADHEANPQDSVPWEEVKAAALARFQKK
jgi:putative addiction module component (TIGR02574 family)